MYEYTGYFDTSVVCYEGTDDIEYCFYAWVLLKGKEIIDWKRGKLININSSTSGELISCSKILKHVLKNRNIKRIQLYGDCQTSIDALNNLYKPRGATSDYFDYTMSILNNLRSIKKKVKITWIPRKFNKLADRLASKGLLDKYAIRHYETSTKKSFAIFHYGDLIGADDNGPITGITPIKKGLSLGDAIELVKKMEEFKTFDEVEVWLNPTNPLGFHKIS